MTNHSSWSSHPLPFMDAFLSPLGFWHPMIVCLCHVDAYLIQFGLWQPMPDGPSLWIPSSPWVVTQLTATSLCVVAFLMLLGWRPALSGPCMEVPFTLFRCSDPHTRLPSNRHFSQAALALTPHTRQQLPVDSLFSLLGFWLPTLGNFSVWSTLVTLLGFWYICQIALYSRDTLSYCLDSCLPMLGTLLCGHHS